MSKNELRVCMFIYTLASIGALKSYQEAIFNEAY